MAIQLAKKTLRTKLKEILKAIPPDEKTRQSEIVIKKLLQNPVYLNSHRVSVYLSRSIEIDTKPILENIFVTGKECFIPKYDSKSTEMDMVKLSSMQEFENLPLTSWSIKQPAESEDSLENAFHTGGLDLIIVPGIGFTKDGDRLGNGRGYYDTCINQYREKFGNKLGTIALAFHEQILPEIPTDAHDIKIDEVLFPDVC